LEFYRNLEAPTPFSSGSESPTVLGYILQYLNAYKASFARPIDSRYDIVLLGGALGSLFSCVMEAFILGIQLTYIPAFSKP
jgi:hypothetical protein